MKTTEDVINEVLQGNIDAFELIVDKYKYKAIGIAMKLMKNKQNSEEVVQESFIKAFKSLSSFEHRASFGTWFYKIVVNTAKNALQKQKKLSEVYENSYDELSEPWLEQIAKDDFTTYEKLTKKELIELIQLAISQLPEKVALVISLYYIQEMTIKEIQEITGIPVGTIKITLYRGRILLQKKLQKALEL